jgi:DinB family protein
MTASATAITPPAAGEYAPYYSRYISLVAPGVDILDQLDRQREEVLARFRNVPESRGAHRYAPGKWSVRQVVCHLTDTERIMAYRALRIARGDATPLAGFDENAYAPESGADAVPLAGLVAEFADVRRASLALFRHLPADAWVRRGTASESPFSVRALAWVLVGHPIHHLGVLRERYGV